MPLNAFMFSEQAEHIFHFTAFINGKTFHKFMLLHVLSLYSKLPVFILINSMFKCKAECVGRNAAFALMLSIIRNSLNSNALPLEICCNVAYLKRK